MLPLQFVYFENWPVKETICGSMISRIFHCPNFLITYIIVTSQNFGAKMKEQV